MLKLFTEARKFCVTLAGAIAIAVSAGLLDGPLAATITGGIGVVTALLVYLIANFTPAVVVVVPTTGAATPT